MENLKILAVIPSRIGSTRLPRKPMALLAGKPMVVRVSEAARRCPDFSKVVVATDSEEILNAVKESGGDAVMTPSDFATGSDRAAYIAKQFPEYTIIVNLQGDEPFVTPSMLSQLVEPFKKGDPSPMATLAFPLADGEMDNPNLVKVICNKNGHALYFSRSPIPYFRTHLAQTVPVYHHMGLYAYKRDFLLNYTKMEQTPLEITESLEQLRAMENGYSIYVSVTQERTIEINTPEELAQAQSIADEFFSKIR